MQSVAEYSARQLTNIEIIQNLIARNDKKGLVNFLMQEQAHQMQVGALLDETRNSYNGNVNNSNSRLGRRKTLRNGVDKTNQ